MSKGAVLPRPPIADPGERQRRFEAVYAAHRGPILGYVLRRTGNPDDAADVIADTFLTAWRRLEELPPEPQARLWLYGVARRVLANHHRGQRRRSALADRLRADLAIAASVTGPPGRLRADLTHSYQPPEFTGEQAQIAQAFRRLPAADRELLALSAWEGLDYGPDRGGPRLLAQCGAASGCSARASGSPPNWPVTPGPGPLSPTSTSRTEASYEPDQPDLPGHRHRRRARLVRPGTFADLGARITAAPPGASAGTGPAAARGRRADR